MRVVSTLVGLAIIGSVPLRAQQSVVQHAERVYASIKTLRATFTQTVTNPLTGSDVTSHGELEQRIPGDVSVRFTDPAGDRIVANGKVVWVYLPSTNPGQVIRAKLGADVGAPDFAAQFLESPRKSYTVTGGSAASIDGVATHSVVLTPKSADSPFQKVTLWVNDSDAMLRRVETVDQSGAVRRITVTKFAKNAPVDANAFVFHVPAGVKVYDGPTG